MSRLSGRVAICVVIAAGVPKTGSAAETPASNPVQSGMNAPAAGAPDRPWGRIELKRENTARGTDEESTKTTLRLEKFLDGPVAALRLDLPLPDERTDFGGSPFQPRLGDIKLRARFRPWRAWDYTFSSFIEATFPTADPENLGSGKYQLSGAVRMIVPLALPFFEDPKAHKAQFETEVQQVVSVAGDAARKDINYTKFELTFYDVWLAEYTFKLKLKPTVDWMQDGRTGGVGEVEGGYFFGDGWRTWLMLGHRLWGPDNIKGTYSTRVELGLARTF